MLEPVQLDQRKTSAPHHFDSAKKDKVIFPDLVNVLTSVLKRAGAKLYVLLDEWSSIPMDLQPYLAEFIKRGFLSCPDVVFKIASLEYRSNFSLRQASGNIVGFELGADILNQRNSLSLLTIKEAFEE